jgi:hypothetical protein
MSDKACLVYNKSKSQEVALNNVAVRCKEIITDNSEYLTTLKRLCGTLCYSSLFLLPDYELANEQKYTFENVCYFVPGLLKMTLHEMLDNLSIVVTSNSQQKIHSALKAILHECMYAEVISLLKVNVKDTYCALLYVYCKLCKNTNHANKVKEFWADNRRGFQYIWSYFEKEMSDVNGSLY